MAMTHATRSRQDSTSRLCKAALLLLLAAGSTSTGVAHADALHDACDASGFQAILEAAPSGSTFVARGYWLNRQLLQWPGVEPSGRFRLYHDADGQVLATRGKTVTGAGGVLALEIFEGVVPAVDAERFKFIGDGPVLAVAAADAARLPMLHRQQLLLVREDAAGRVLDATALQVAGALDAIHAGAEGLTDLGASIADGSTRFRLWAPTARAVSVCVHDTGTGKASASEALQWDGETGSWSASLSGDRSGKYYTYLVDVFVPGVGVVRNRVTDPYSISLSTDSKRSYIADLDAAALKPAGWDAAPFPAKVQAQTDMAIYELHVRDFSISDASVSAAHRGKYLAFTERTSDGMRHLRALSDAGLTDVHLLPVFDFATVPETGCVAPTGISGAPDGESQQARVMALAQRDCFNWGYDSYHFNAPEGSYASDAADGARRIVEFRQMVVALHEAGLRVGMDVVYNHTTASGQKPSSVLDRIVPGYYQRLDANGVVERSTCCDNTATEHRMMAKLMIDSAVLWAKHYRIDSFRFDLMGHQPRVAMEALRTRVDAATGRKVNLIGEGWNFGEVAEGARFVQASQLSLNGSGIGTFSDRARDAMRGGGPADSGPALVAEQGWLNGLVYDRNAGAPERPATDLMHAADLVRVGLAGSIRDYPITAHVGTRTTLSGIDYRGQPAGYASEPAEVVNYVENHDNQALFDSNAYKLPRGTSSADRARVQALGMAVTALSQGVAYFHAGVDTLRSKSMDRNSYDSGDWFNRLDWTYRDNHFATGLPPEADNGANYDLIRPLLRDAAIKPVPRDIAWTRDVFRDLLRIRTSSTLLRLRSAADIRQRLRLLDTGPAQNPVLVAAHIDGEGYPGARFHELLYLVNVDPSTQAIALGGEAGKRYVLHPVHRADDAADARARDARYDAASGRFTVPPRTAVVYVVE